MVGRLPWLSLSLMGLLVGRTIACGSDVTDTVDDGFDRTSLLQSIAENVVSPTYAAMRSDAEDLVVKATAYRDVLEQDLDGSVARSELQNAWRSAMQQWQQAELMQIGPAGPAARVAAGEDLRDEIYSWPTVNPCRVDQELVDETYANTEFFTNELVNVYGFDALEYLLFRDDTTNSCPPQLDINNGAWASIQNELALRRARYAEAIAAGILAQTEALDDAWDPNTGDFFDRFVRAGDPDTPYANAQEALDDVLSGMFYLDTWTKDEKLGTPAGLTDQCVSAPCLDALESQWAEHSREQVLANLQAFKLLFQGGASPEIDVGFDDFLVALGAEEVANTMAADIDAAISAVGDASTSFRSELTQDATSLNSAHATVRAVTSSLKGDFVITLQLTIPQQGAGDAD